MSFFAEFRYIDNNKEMYIGLYNDVRWLVMLCCINWSMVECTLSHEATE